MNALRVSQSRFAVLKIEDDDVSEPVSPSKTIKAKKGNSSGTATNQNSASSNKTKKKKKTNNVNNNKNVTTADTADSSLCSKHGKIMKPNDKQGAAKTQWEEWKEKDNKFVSEVFEQDLQQALLQSKLEFEEHKKQVNEQTKSLQSSEDQKKKKVKKKDKPSTMSLEEFQNLNGSDESVTESYAVSNKVTQSELPASDKNFFCELEKDMERILQREHIRDSARAIDVQKGDKLLCLQHEKEIREKEGQVKELTVQVEKLQDELKLVKTRNKKLCNILAQGEMREKAEILVEVDRLTQIKDELTQQVSELHAALEQEKSKVHSLQLELKRHQENKRDTK